jgi:DNA repair exonuclease SbcCD ATPase subunit
MTIDERVEKLETELNEAQESLDEWKTRRDNALDDLHEAFDEDAGTYKRSVVLAEAREAVSHFERKVAKLEKSLERAKRQAKRAEYEERKPLVANAKRDALAELDALDDEIVELVKTNFERAWEVIAAVNSRIEKLNHLAQSVGQPTMQHITKYNGMSEAAWAEGAIRAAAQSGDLDAGTAESPKPPYMQR